MEAFGVDAIFTPERPVVSARGAVVTNISHIPLALTAVMKCNDITPDFSARGTLLLKPWIANDQGLRLPEHLAIPTVEAVAPYNEQIKALALQVGAVIPRQSMKDKSGASVMDPKTQVTSVHGHSVLDLALEPLEANFALPLVHESAGENDRAMLDIAVAAEMNLVGRPGAFGRRRGARRRKFAQYRDGSRRVHHRSETHRTGAGMHQDLDRSVRVFRAARQPG